MEKFINYIYVSDKSNLLNTVMNNLSANGSSNQLFASSETDISLELKKLVGILVNSLKIDNVNEGIIFVAMNNFITEFIFSVDTDKPNKFDNREKGYSLIEVSL